jgi:hypothetical protein
MLKGLAFAPALHKSTQRHELRFAQSSFEFEIKFHPGAAKGMRGQMLCIQSRIFDPVFLEIRGRRL